MVYFVRITVFIGILFYLQAYVLRRRFKNWFFQSVTAKVKLAEQFVS
jgi:hypothetical protein